MNGLDRWLAPVERALMPLAERINRLVVPDWAWPAAMLAIGLVAALATVLWAPAADEHVRFLGLPWGETCGFYVVTGAPCPQCGMTRSWLWMGRGEVVRALSYSPAGATLWLWLVVTGVVGALRLATGRYASFGPSRRLLSAWTLVWLVGLWGAVWVGRVTVGLLPLPMPHDARESPLSR